jgi:hypothetical protein
LIAQLFIFFKFFVQKKRFANKHSILYSLAVEGGDECNCLEGITAVDARNGACAAWPGNEGENRKRGGEERKKDEKKMTLYKHFFFFTSDDCFRPAF